MWPNPLLKKDSGINRGVLFLPGDKVGQVVIVVMNQGVLEMSRRPVRHDHFVHGSLPARAPAQQQPRLVIGIPTRSQSQAAKDVIVAWYGPGHLLVTAVRHRPHFLRQFRRGPLVPVHEKNPVRLYPIHRRVVELGIVLKRM